MSDQKNIINEQELINVTGGEAQRDPGENMYNNAKSVGGTFNDLASNDLASNKNNKKKIFEK